MARFDRRLGLGWLVAKSRLVVLYYLSIIDKSGGRHAVDG